MTKLLQKVCLIFLAASPLPACCQQSNLPAAAIIDTTVKQVQKPFRFITNVPGNIERIIAAPFHKSNLKGFLITAGATAILLPLDQAVTDGVKHFSRQVHLNPETDYKVALKFGQTKIIKIPQNLNSALYQLGEGGTSMMLAAGIYLCGKITHSKREHSCSIRPGRIFYNDGHNHAVFQKVIRPTKPFYLY